jgi:uracil DNA glycosylase
MDVKIADSWKKRLQEEFSKAYFKQLADFVKAEYSSCKVFPKGRHIFLMHLTTAVSIILRWSLLARIPITVTDRPMVCAFQ